MKTPATNSLSKGQRYFTPQLKGNATKGVKKSKNKLNVTLSGLEAADPQRVELKKFNTPVKQISEKSEASTPLAANAVEHDQKKASFSAKKNIQAAVSPRATPKSNSGKLTSKSTPGTKRHLDDSEEESRESKPVLPQAKREAVSPKSGHKQKPQLSPSSGATKTQNASTLKRKRSAPDSDVEASTDVEDAICDGEDKSELKWQIKTEDGQQQTQKRQKRTSIDGPTVGSSGSSGVKKTRNGRHRKRRQLKTTDATQSEYSAAEEKLLAEIRKRIQEKDARTLRLRPVPKKTQVENIRLTCPAAVSILLNATKGQAFLMFGSRQDSVSCQTQLTATKQANGKPRFNVQSCAELVKAKATGTGADSGRWKLPETRELSSFNLTKLYVSSLPTNLDKTRLAKHFPLASSVQVPVDERGSRMGIAQISFSDREAALSAFNECHGKLINGIPMHVNFAAKATKVTTPDSSEKPRLVGPQSAVSLTAKQKKKRAFQAMKKRQAQPGARTLTQLAKSAKVKRTARGLRRGGRKPRPGQKKTKKNIRSKAAGSTGTKSL